MQPPGLSRFIIVTILSLLLLHTLLAAADGCSKNSPLVGFLSDLHMIQHQLRGRVTILDDCTFKVSRFDMLGGSDQVYWWGAQGENLHNQTQGFKLSDVNLNQTYQTVDAEFTLLNNVTWDQVRVLSVWDVVTASSFGYIILNSTWNSTESPPPPSSPSSSSPPPTVFESCIELSPEYRFRWSLAKDNTSVDIGLEAVVPETSYMAFGWSRPGERKFFMRKSDVVVAGFKDRDTPFAEDYYISKYSECNWDFQNPAGVCPDYVYNNTNAINATGLSVYGQHKDGVAMIRYTRALQSSDTELDVSVDPGAEMTVVWALGKLKPPDVIQPFYWPQNHGGPGNVAFGHMNLTLAKQVYNCTGPLVASEIEPIDVIVADRGSPLTVTVDDAVHYPNPPSPTKVFYINKKEAPILKVERGVPVIFSVQAGHDNAFYLTTDPVGGASNLNETIFAGGPDAHGVPSHPLPLTWLPNRTTPDEVYYQAFFEKKMGWKIQVVDGGLSDMYNNSVILAEQQVTLFWTISGNNISYAVRGERKSGYIAIAFGRGMVNSFAYVGWVGADSGHVKSYWIDGRDASSIHPTSEELWDVKCSSDKGVVTFEFTRGLQPVCTDSKSDKMCKKNVVDPSVPLRLVWAMGAKWDANFPSDRNMHDRTSRRATVVHLAKGAAEAEQEVKPVLVVHGFMMFLAWGVLFPGGIIAARYLKHLDNDVWFQTHTYLQYSGVTVMFLAFLFAFSELRGLHTESFHVKLGLFSMLLVCWNPVNAYFRPKKTQVGQEPERKRVLWEYVHVLSGRGALLVGLVTLVTGMSLLTDIYGPEHLRGFQWGLFAWTLMVCGIIGYLEVRQYWNKGRRNGSEVAWDAADGRSIHVLDSDEEDDSVELLQQQQAPSRGMEVQLEAFR